MSLTQKQIEALAENRKAKIRSLRRYQSPTPSASIEAEYMVSLRKVPKEVTKLFEQYVIPVLKRLEPLYSAAGTMQDEDLGESLQTAFTALEVALSKQGEKLRKYSRDIATKTFTRAGKFQRKAWIAEIKKLAGVDITKIINDKEVEALLLKSIDKNMALIETMRPQYVEQLKKAVKKGIATGDDFHSIKKQLDQVHSTHVKFRPKLIARDQMSKLTGALNQIRQEDIGIKSYRWQTSHDERVRESHRANNGRVFTWAAPPATGHPGEDINCRCVAEPVFEEWLAGLESQKGWEPDSKVVNWKGPKPL